ncbi:unnamed protein product [marine sediment metagenome]|uniref:Uncharacterized protein n=1 Tax=marine sediment metagenome TaxID=412755 RepID=X1S8H4_9ZZZZ
MAKKKKELNSKKLDIIEHIKSMNSRNRVKSEKYDINQDLADVLREVLRYVNESTNLNKRNVKPISVLQCVPIWKTIVNNLVGNYPHIANSLKDTLTELFTKLSEAIQNNNRDDLSELLNNNQFRR